MRSISIGRWPRVAAHFAIRTYQLTLSSLVGRQCRHLPTCSSFTDEAIQLHGLWAGGWMGFARICRCTPWGTSGYDPVPEHVPAAAGTLTPWRYGFWRAGHRCGEHKAGGPSGA
ncbi:MAG: rane protein insertion efficiency factor YidD [Hyphomicrobiales bacterium]|nr:rane protein insertion efficiency factor YidD [Hyphomicrobiales bacterium]